MAVPRRLERRRRSFDPRRKKGLDTRMWLRVWGSVCGVALVVGFLTPIVFPQRDFWSGQTTYKTILFTDLLKDADAKIAFFVLLPLVVGLAAGILSNLVKGPALPISLLGVSFVSMLFSVYVLGASEVSREFTPAPTGTGSSETLLPGVVFLMMVFSAIAVAAGNHLRKLHKIDMLSRVMLGIGGIGLLLSFLIPAFDGKPLLFQLLQEEALKNAWALLLILLGLVAYGVLGAVNLAFAEEKPELTKTVSISGRILLGLVPGSFFLMFMVLGKDAGGGALCFFLIIMKVFLIFYGYMILIPVGLLGLFDELLGGAAPGTHERTARGRRASEEEARRKLRTLQDAFEDGVIDEEAYRSKRRAIRAGMRRASGTPPPRGRTREDAEAEEEHGEETPEDLHDRLMDRDRTPLSELRRIAEEHGVEVALSDRGKVSRSETVQRVLDTLYG